MGDDVPQASNVLMGDLVPTSRTDNSTVGFRLRGVDLQMFHPVHMNSLWDTFQPAIA